MSVVEDFFRAIDAQWTAPKTRLSIIGSGALMLQADYERGTKDGDVFETTDLTDATKTELRRLAGPNTTIHKRQRLYIDIVGNGIPFLPQKPMWNPVTIELNNLELYALDIVDVIVSKLKRFNANDQDDIHAMALLELLPHDRLVERFKAAVDFDSRTDQLGAWVDNLHRVERDMLFVDETEIELPSRLSR